MTRFVGKGLAIADARLHSFEELEFEGEHYEVAEFMVGDHEFDDLEDSMHAAGFATARTAATGPGKLFVRFQRRCTA